MIVGGGSWAVDFWWWIVGDGLWVGVMGDRLSVGVSWVISCSWWVAGDIMLLAGRELWAVDCGWWVVGSRLFVVGIVQ